MTGSCLATFTFDVVAAADACDERHDLEAVIGRAFDHLGASVYVGIEARSGVDGAAVHVSFGRTSPDWEAHYFAAGHAAHDPVVKHMLASPELAYWSDLTSGERPLASRERQVFEEARAFGFSEGLAAPLHHPGGGVSAVLLMGDGLDGRDPRQRHAAHMISHAFSRAARRLRLAKPRASQDRPHLSRRETEAVGLLRGGASNKLIGRQLGLSQHTVADLLQSARRKLGACTRTELAFIAHDLGLLQGEAMNLSAASTRGGSHWDQEAACA